MPALILLLVACTNPDPLTTDTSVFLVPPTTVTGTTTGGSTPTNTLGWPPPGEVIGRFVLAGDENGSGQTTTEGWPEVQFFTAVEGDAEWGDPITKVGECGTPWELRIHQTAAHDAGAVNLTDVVDNWPATLDPDGTTYGWDEPIWGVFEDSRLGTPFLLSAEGSAEIPAFEIAMGRLPDDMPDLLTPSDGRALDVDNVHLAWDAVGNAVVRIDVLDQPDITAEPEWRFSCLVENTGSYQMPVSGFHDAFGTVGKVTVEIAVISEDARYHEVAPDRWVATSLQARGFATSVEITLDAPL